MCPTSIVFFLDFPMEEVHHEPMISLICFSSLLKFGRKAPIALSLIFNRLSNVVLDFFLQLQVALWRIASDIYLV